MDISFDYRDLFKILNRYRVKYLVVGAYAVIYYTEPRFTKDLDICIQVSQENAHRTYNALKAFGAPLKKITENDFAKKNMIYQIGVAPIRIDILMGLPGIAFDAAWRNRVRSKYGGVLINIIGMKDLIKSKRNSKRIHDRIDLKKLKRTMKKLREK